MAPLTACAWLVLGLAAASPIAHLPAQPGAWNLIKRQENTTESTLPASSVVPASSAVPVETTAPRETVTPSEPEPEPEPEDEDEDQDGRDWCINQKLDDENIAKEIWNDWGVGAYMDEKIAEVGEDKWLTTLGKCASDTAVTTLRC